jgi:hypothetical protein
MSINDYAFIKDGIVVNTVVIEDASEELFDECKNTFNLDHVIKTTEKAVIGSAWNGLTFILPQPYPSWILNEEEDWEAPIPMPINQDKAYSWNEETLSWHEIDLTITPTE